MLLFLSRERVQWHRISQLDTMARLLAFTLLVFCGAAAVKAASCVLSTAQINSIDFKPVAKACPAGASQGAPLEAGRPAGGAPPQRRLGPPNLL